MADDKAPPAKPKAPRKKAATPKAPAVGLADVTPKAAKTTIAQVKETATGFAAEAATAARNVANEGKDRASDALDTLSKVVDNAAGLVEEKIGPSYGTYARKAATGVSDFAEKLKGKDVDAIVEDTRNFVRKSPMVAIGAAAAIGFVLTRLARLGGSSDKDA